MYDFSYLSKTRYVSGVYRRISKNLYVKSFLLWQNFDCNFIAINYSMKTCLNVFER